MPMRVLRECQDESLVCVVKFVQDDAAARRSRERDAADVGDYDGNGTWVGPQPAWSTAGFATF